MVVRDLKCKASGGPISNRLHRYTGRVPRSRFPSRPTAALTVTRTCKEASASG